MVKHIVLDGVHLNVKSFKVPNAVNKFVYRFFRKSKAQRSYEYAMYLLARDIGTPPPVAYIEYQGPLSLGKSYYVSIHLAEDLTFRTLIDHPGYPDREEILRHFTRFTYRLHREHIQFLDHSPGNTLIKKQAGGKYGFYLVDLNRMKLNARMDFEDCMRSFARLSATEEMLQIMSDEYAAISGLDQKKVFRSMQYHTMEHHQRRLRQKKINKQLGKYKD